MRSSVSWPCAFVLSAAIFGAGCGPAHFSCTDSSECRSGAVVGVCQSNGVCSFPDDACASGQRYGQHGPPELAGQCVPSTDVVDGSTSGDTVEPDTVEPDATSSSSTTETEPSTTSSSTTSDEGDSNESSGSDGGPAGCAAGFRDDFEGDSLDPGWSSEIDPAMQLLFMGGQLLVVYSESLSWSDLSTVEVFDFTNAELVLELDYFTGLPYGTELNFGFRNEDANLRITICCGAVLAQDVVDGSVVTHGSADWDDARFLRLRTQDGEAHFETSHDGTAWTTLAVEDLGLDLSGARLYIGAGTWEETDETARPAIARLESLELCTAP